MNYKSEHGPDIETTSEEFPVMSFQEYAKRQHTIPYIFELQKGGKKLVYFGADHSNNPTDEMFTDIENRFQQFKPDVVIVEGIPSLSEKKELAKQKAKEISRDEVIEKFGEPGFTLKLAAEADINMESPEPKYGDEINHLLGLGFTQNEIFAFYMYRYISQYHRMPNKPKIKNYLQTQIEHFRTASQWNNFDYSVDNLQNVGHTIWGDRAGFNDADFASQRVDPVPWQEEKGRQTRVNQVAAACNIFRDKFIVKRVREILKTQDKVFVVYGASHGYMQEPALRKAFETL